jgi:hypothetical protein
MIEIRQKIFSPKIIDFVSAIKKELKKGGLYEKVKPGLRIAITAGSRSISHYPLILNTVVNEVKKAGGKPFLIPAMGSHGGSTPEGQIETLRSLGVTTESVGAPIYSSMEVKEIGRLKNGTPVYVDRIAANSDGIIVINRVKPHTDFKGIIESGLMKMMAIGLGKQKGAEAIHSFKAEGYHKHISGAARIIIKKAPIILGLAIVENTFHEISLVKSLKPENIEKEEKNLLKKAKNQLARIPFKEIDVLIIEEFGKNISGMGMDTNITGRFWIPGEFDPKASKIKMIVVLDLSEETYGNATGIGMADLVTKKLVDKIDYHSTFINCLTAGWPEVGKTPIYLPNDREAILTAIRICGPLKGNEVKVVRIKNTLDLEHMWISAGLYEVVQTNKKFSALFEVLGEPKDVQFDVSGMLVR